MARRASLLQPIRSALTTGRKWAGRDRWLRPPSDADQFLSWSVSFMRLATVGVLLLVTLTQPVRGRFDQLLELNILAFAGYVVAVEMVRVIMPRWRSWVWVALLDLPVVTVIYAFGAAPGGLLFVLVFLAVMSAAVTLPLRWSLWYTLATALMMVAIDPSFPLWFTDAGDLRRLLGRLLIVGLTGLGLAILTLRLRFEGLKARTSRDQAEHHAGLNRVRSEFIAMISHDLRTPLAGARAGASMLEASAAERLRPDERELLASTRRNIQRLGRLIDDLLTLNQLEAGAMELAAEPLDLRRVVAAVLPAAHPLIMEKQQTLEVDLPQALPVLGERRRLEQVVLNLLANAQQHTPPGTRICISSALDETEVWLRVFDTGPAIPPSEHARIWDRFYQAGGKHGGAGLGLAIVKGIVELHGGRAAIENLADDGKAFVIALPRRGGDPQDV